MPPPVTSEVNLLLLLLLPTEHPSTFLLFLLFVPVGDVGKPSEPRLLLLLRVSIVLLVVDNDEVLILLLVVRSVGVWMVVERGVQGVEGSSVATGGSLGKRGVLAVVDEKGRIESDGVEVLLHLLIFFVGRLALTVGMRMLVEGKILDVESGKEVKSTRRGLGFKVGTWRAIDVRFRSELGESILNCIVRDLVLLVEMVTVGGSVEVRRWLLERTRARVDVTVVPSCLSSPVLRTSVEAVPASVDLNVAIPFAD